jgi:hypothetical protein
MTNTQLPFEEIASLVQSEFLENVSKEVNF